MLNDHCVASCSLRLNRESSYETLSVHSVNGARVSKQTSRQSPKGSLVSVGVELGQVRVPGLSLELPLRLLEDGP